MNNNTEIQMQKILYNIYRNNMFLALKFVDIDQFQLYKQNDHLQIN